MSEARLREYVVDLTTIKGHGDFPCPNCGQTISPDDESEEIYTILDTKATIDHLEELIIQCRKCLSRIRMTGFLVLDTEET